MTTMQPSPLSPLRGPAASARGPAPLPGPGELAVVVGSGRSGRAACRLLLGLGARVRLLEEREEALTTETLEAVRGAEVLAGPHGPAQFEGARLVVPSPGVPLRRLLEAMGKEPSFPLESEEGPNILAETELAWRFLGAERLVAVTGTSGKTTTVHLIGAMLREAGLRTVLAGNVGTPLSEYVLAGRGADAVVLEISSFQLQTCMRLRPHVAVLMNITPNHLDYHRDMEEYVDAKLRLFACMGEEDRAVVPAEWRKAYVQAGFRAPMESVELRGLFPETRLLGEHNRLNAETAWACASFLGCGLEAARRAVKNFEPLPHRLEMVAEKGGVLYVNDSKCTTVSSLETALRAMERPALLLCGGRFKGGDLEALRPLVRERVRLVAGFGESEEIFSPAWRDLVPLRWFPTLDPALAWLHAEARPGEAVLLAPGTASFDLYKGMAMRGAHFRRLVEALS